MDILNATVEQHHVVMLETVQSETFKKIVAAGSSGLELSSKSKLLTREPDALHNLLVLQLVERAVSQSKSGADLSNDDEAWRLLDLSPYEVKGFNVEDRRLYRASALGVGVWRVMVETVQPEATLEGLRDSLQYIMSAEWCLHCKLDKVHWEHADVRYKLLRRLEVLWSEFVGLVAADVTSVAERLGSEMTEPTRLEITGLLNALRVVEAASVGNPSESAMEAFDYLVRLVDEWPLRVAMTRVPQATAEGPAEKQRGAWRGDPEEWIAALFKKMGPRTRTQIEQHRNADGGPAWGRVQKTKFWQDYMAHRKERGEFVPKRGKQVPLDEAESKLARKSSNSVEPELNDDNRADEADIASYRQNRFRASQIERLVRESNAETAKDDALYRKARRRSDQK